MEKSALISVFTRFRDRLRGSTVRITGNPTEADDILQDAFCKLWTTHRDIESETEALKLSHTVVRNSAISSLRQRRQFTPLPEEYIPDLFESQDTPHNENEEICSALIKLSAEVLSQRLYEIFILHDVQNVGYAEVAQKLNLTQENVRAILSRSRKILREIYISRTK